MSLFFAFDQADANPKVQASDLQNNITYGMEDDAGGNFSIDVDTGAISLSDNFDPEFPTKHSIEVTATHLDGSVETRSFLIDVNNQEIKVSEVPDGNIPDSSDVEALLEISPADTVKVAPNVEEETATPPDATSPTISRNADEFDVGTISDSDVTGNAVDENAASGTIVGITALAVDPDGSDSVSYTLSDDAGGKFAIDAGSGVVTVAGSIDREVAASYDIEVTATSTDGSTSVQTFTIGVNDVDEFNISATSDSDGSANAVSESAVVGTAVGVTALATDGDVTDSVTYSLSSNPGSFFAIDANSGIVTVANGLDYETGTSHTIEVTSTSSDGSTSTQSFTIGVTDADEFDVGAISDSNASANAVDENASIGATVGITASASDGDGTDDVTYTLSDDAGGKFAIDASTGIVTVAGGIDREAAASHTIEVTATSTDGSTSTQSYTINVNDIDEFDVTQPTDSNVAANVVAEDAANGTIVGVTASASDADATNNAVTYSLVDGSGDPIVGGAFAVDAVTGIVTVADNSQLDYETATSQTINVEATSSDGSTSVQAFTIGLSNAMDETPTDITIDGGVVKETVSSGGTIDSIYDPSGATVAALSTTDADAGDSFTYVITNDPSGKFEIVGNEVRVKAGQSIDFETDTSFGLTIQVTDGGGNTYSEAITINVQDYEGNYTSSGLHEGITGTSEEDTLTGDAGTNIIVGGTGDDTIDGGDGSDIIEGGVGADVLTGGAGIDTARYWGSSSGIQINLETQTVTGGEATGDTISGFENVTASAHADTIVGSSGDNAINAQQGDDTITGGGGDDNISGGSGTDTVILSGNWSDYTITQSGNYFTIVDTRPGSPDGTDTVSFVENFQFADGIVAQADILNDAPTDIAASGGSVAENSAGGTIVATLSSTDADSGIASETATYAITSDPSGNFEIVGNEVRVKAGANIDFELHQIHEVAVQVTDAHGASYSETLTFNVNNLMDEGPTDILVDPTTGLGSNLVVNGSFENPDVASGSIQNFSSITGWQADVGVVQIHDNFGGHTASDGNQYLDVDGEAGIDAIYQDIGTDAGSVYRLSFDAADRIGHHTNGFEVYWNGTSVANIEPAHTNWATYEFDVVGTGGQDRLEFREIGESSDAYGSLIDSVQLQEVLDPSVVENAAANTIVATLSAVDADSGDSHSYTMITDISGNFEIVGNEVRVKAGADINYESDISHDIIVEVIDSGGNSYQETITINVTDVNEAPTDIVLSSNSVDESAAAGTVVAILTPVDPDTGETFTYDIGDLPGDIFEIVGNELRVSSTASLDFENNASHTFSIAVTDSAGHTFDKEITIDVNDVNEAPTDIIVDQNQGISINADGGNNAYLYASNGGDIVGCMSAMTIEVEFSSNHTAGTDMNLFSYHAGGASDEIELGVNDYGSGAGLYIEIGEQAVAINSYDATQLLDGGDHQVSLTWDNVAGDWEIFVDGNSVASGTGVSAGHSIAAGGTIVLGQEQDSNGGSFDNSQGFDGTYYDVRIFDDVRTDTEIANNALSEVSSSEPGLVANWQMDNLSGGVTTETVSGNNLTVGNVTGTGWVASTPSLVTSITEDMADGRVVAVMSTTDVDAGDSFTYAITNDPSGNFVIVGNEVRIKAGADLDYETATSHDVTVEVTDAGGNTYSEVVTVNVENVNEAPTDITFTGNGALGIGVSVNAVNLEDSAAPVAIAAGTIVAAVASVIDQDVGDSFSYALSDDAGGVFQIDAGTGEVSLVAEHDTSSAFSDTVTVQVTDAGGNTFSETIGINLGTGGADTFNGTGDTDIIYGLDGNDTISGGAGDDILYGSAADAQATKPTNVSIQNSSFETQALSDGNNTGAATDWVVTGSAGTFDPASNHLSTAPDGENVSYATGGSSLKQTFAETFDSDSDYSLTVNVGNANGSGSGQPYEIRIFAGGTLVGSQSGTEPGADQWTEVTVAVDGTSYPGLDGQAISVELVNTGGDSSFSNIIYFDDVSLTKTTDGESDTLLGGGGNDTLIGGAGADVLDGGAGTDTADYSTSDAGVAVDLAANSGSAKTALSDASVSVSAKAELSDTSVSISAGDALSDTSVLISAGDAVGDTYVSIENITGSAFNDKLTGDGNANTLRGGAGNDQLSGGAESDIFQYAAGDGSDTFDGGAGGGWTDVIDLLGMDGSVSISGDTVTGQGWTMEIKGGTIDGQTDETLDLSDDSSGTITFDDGSSLDFDNIEQVQW